VVGVRALDGHGSGKAGVSCQTRQVNDAHSATSKGRTERNAPRPGPVYRQIA